MSESSYIVSKTDKNATINSLDNGLEFVDKIMRKVLNMESLDHNIIK